MYFRWVSDCYLSNSTGTTSERFLHTPRHRTKKSLSDLGIGYFSLIPILITMPQVKGGSPFFGHQWDQRIVNHQTHIIHFLLNSVKLSLLAPMTIVSPQLLVSSFLTMPIHCLLSSPLRLPQPLTSHSFS